jgi:hypothetical protein
MKIFNLFKKKKATSVAPITPVAPTKNHYNTDIMNYTINGKNYAIADSQLIKVQSVADDVHLYGWSLETRWKRQNGEWYNWMTYWNHRVYVSRSSALDAATKIFPHWTFDSNGIYKYSKNTLFIQMEEGNIRVVKNKTERNKTIYSNSKMILDDLIKNEQVEEVNIKNEKWAHPHLCKELKIKLIVSK